MCLTFIAAKHKLKEFAKDTSKIKLSAHARLRMKERNITFKQIICCFEHGDIIEGPFPDLRGNTQLNVRVLSAGDTVICTVVIRCTENGDHSIVVTAFKK